ncbi:retrovirus-related pol polyprotein from transposon TNT 1-94 [Tanacetum coccineum]
MYKVKTDDKQEVHTQANKSVLTSTRLNGVNSVRRPSTRSSSSKNSVLSNTKIHSEVVEVYAEKNKKTNVTSRMNAVKIKKHVANVHTKNALIASADVIQIVLWIVDSRCSKHMNGNLKLLNNFVEKFMGTIRFGNDHFAVIIRYQDYVHGNITICHVYYVEGLGHNLFSVGQFCDGDLEVAFRSKTCYVRNLEGDDLLTGARDSNLYTISISDMIDSYPVCLMFKATSTKSWLLHRRLLNLNFGTINHLTKQDLFDGLPKFKDGKDHLCFACEQGKSKKASLQPKLVPSTHSKLELIHMDLCRPMRVESINDKKYILVIVDDYSRYTWVYFLRTKDEAPDMIMKFLLNNSPCKNTQQNGVVERRNRTLYLSEGTTLISNDVANESILEDSANLEANKLITLFCPPKTEEELLKNHGMDGCDSISTLMATTKLDANLHGTPTDQTKYRSMIRGLMYLTASRPDSAFATFDSSCEPIAYSVTDHAGCHDDCKSTSEAYNFWEKN